MKKLLILTILCIVMLLSACSQNSETRSSIPDDLVLVTADKKEISLYMSREDAEEVLGNGETAGFPAGMVDYEDFSIGYTNGVVTMIRIDNNKCKTKSNVTIGSSVDDIKNSHNYGRFGGVIYSYDTEKDTYSLIEEKDTDERTRLTREMKNVHDGAQLSYDYDQENKKTNSLLITDQYIAVTMKLDRDE